MMKRTLLIGIGLLLNGSFIFSMNPDSAQKIGMKIWHNEASGRRDLLVFWNIHEAFPSLGIGHCIWHPQGKDIPYTQVFPQLCDYLQNHGVQLPEWLKQAKNLGAPWESRDEFLQDISRTEELRKLLESSIDLQTAFMIERLDEQLPCIVQAASYEKRERITRYIVLMKSSELGTYALVDYLNFKGSGLNPQEESRGEQWGLLQVLLDMPDNLTTNNVTKAFTISAAKMLLKRIQNSGPEYGTVRFLHGWMKRLGTYVDANILKN